ncbi:xylulokinase [Planosporangium sp. 12N6]|uniref:xylulokinase n=1 Tax=Planosporangium spinosum TaxID=3402278 RepID=UPI003CF98850
MDLGTSGLKVALVGADGRPLATAETGYPIDSPQPGWAQTDPRVWDAALDSALDQIGPALAAGAPRAVGVSGQMHGAVLCDAGGAAVRPAVLWPDRRATPLLGRWRELPEAVRERLANPLVAGMTGPVMAWLAEHEPTTVARAEVLLFPKDYLRLRLGGPAVTERSDASATLLWDLPADTWSAPALRAASVPDRLVPPVVDSDRVVARTDRLAVHGGPAGVPVVAGCADTPAALLATGPLTGGAIQVNLGTGAQVLRPVDRPPVGADPPVHGYADTGSGWYAMAAVQNAGLALDWVRRLFDLAWPDLFALAEGVPPGAGGVSFLPFLTGERGGVAPAGSRAGWLGMTAATARAELVRAAVEAMVFAVRRAVDLLDAAGHPVRLTGGGGRSDLVARLLADALEVPVRRVTVPGASATGAAILAARGVGIALPPAADYGPVLSPRSAPALLGAYRRWRDRLAVAAADGD